MLTLRLKPALDERLEALARRTGRTKTFYVLRAIEKCLPEFEEAYPEVVDAPSKDVARVRKAIERLKSVRQGVSKPHGVTLKEMIQSGRH